MNADLQKRRHKVHLIVSVKINPIKNNQAASDGTMLFIYDA